MNMLVTRLEFGVKRFKAFRKRLVLDYKKGGKHDHKNPHAIPLQTKQKLLKAKKGGDWQKIRQLQRQSLTPFGRFAKHGFIFQKDKLPTYDIPNIDGFQLLPYVEYLAPLMDEKLNNYQEAVNKEAITAMSSQVGQLEGKAQIEVKKD